MVFLPQMVALQPGKNTMKAFPWPHRFHGRAMKARAASVARDEFSRAGGGQTTTFRILVCCDRYRSVCCVTVAHRGRESMQARVDPKVARCGESTVRAEGRASSRRGELRVPRACEARCGARSTACRCVMTHRRLRAPGERKRLFSLLGSERGCLGSKATQCAPSTL